MAATAMRHGLPWKTRSGLWRAAGRWSSPPAWPPRTQCWSWWIRAARWWSRTAAISAWPMCSISDPGKVGDRDQRVARRLEPEQLGAVGRGQHQLGVGDVDPAQPPAQPRGSLLEGRGHAEIAAVRDHHRAARIHQLQHRVRGGHAGGEDQRPAALQSPDRVFQGKPGRIAVAAIAVASVADVGAADVGGGEHDRWVERCVGAPRRATSRDGDRLGVCGGAASLAGVGHGFSLA